MIIYLTKGNWASNVVSDERLGYLDRDFRGVCRVEGSANPAAFA